MRIARQSKLGTAEMSEVLLGVKSNMRRGEMDIALGALNRV